MKPQASAPGSRPGALRHLGKSKTAGWSSRFFQAAAALLCLVLTGCAPREPAADLVIANGKEPESLDPAIIVGQADGRVVNSLFEGLTRYDPKTANPIPGLAERWEISSDGRIYTFSLRTTAAWSTGDPITAHDLVYSWLRILDPATAADYVGILFYVKNAEGFNTGRISDRSRVGIHALDARTVRVELVAPTPFFLDLCAYPTLAVVPRQTIERHGDRWLMARPLPVSGAYQLVSWRLNDKIRLRKNPYYWDSANTQSEVVDLLPASAQATVLNLYETEQVDIVWDKDIVPTELLDILRQRRDFHVFDYLGAYFFRYNVTRKPFDDVRVRQALALVIDKKRIVEKITKGGERPAAHLVPPGTGNYVSPPGLGYDPERARRLLAEAGFRGGKGFPRFDYLFNSSRDHEKIGVELQEMWARELGIHVELRSLEWKAYLQAQGELDYDLSRSSWIGDYNDPNTFLDIFMSHNPNNRTGWRNERYDQLVRQANSLTDLPARAKLLQEAEALLVRDELPIVPLYVYVGFNFFDPEKITGIYNNIRDEHPLRAIRKIKQ
ncbi:MAG: peptide ABC transporter substrate-binding protein [Verrucomicrobiota bacterium]|mgnify:CR=1 FL=1